MTVIRMIALLDAFPPVVLCQAPAALTVQGIGEKSAALTAADLSNLPRQTVKTTDRDGPFQVVVPGEKRPSRWVRQVTALRIKQAS